MNIYQHENGFTYTEDELRIYAGQEGKSLEEYIKSKPLTLKRGKAKGLATVTNSLFQNALDGNVTAQIFYLKNTDPETWSDRQQVDHQVNLNDIIRDRKVLIDKGQVRDRTEQEPKKALTTAYKEVGPVVLNQKTQKNKDLSVAPSSKPSNNEQLEGED